MQEQVNSGHTEQMDRPLANARHLRDL
jgi:hypothetical protein